MIIYQQKPEDFYKYAGNVAYLVTHGLIDNAMHNDSSLTNLDTSANDAPSGQPTSSIQSAGVTTDTGYNPADPGFWDVIGNVFTGNLDYHRQLQSALRAESVSAREASLAREFSASEAEKNRKWQEELSNSAYSRAIRDLKSVGINPYALGGASTATVPSVSNPTAYAGQGYNSSVSSGTVGMNAVLNLITTAFKEAIKKPSSITYNIQ